MSESHSCLLRNDQLLLQLVPTKDVIPNGGVDKASTTAIYKDWTILVTIQDTADPGPQVSTVSSEPNLQVS
jgi:hypothetical protein